MTIERREYRNRALVSRRRVIPGFEETLSPTPLRGFFGLYDIYTSLKVVDDDKIQITYADRKYNPDTQTAKLVNHRSVTMKKHRINEHTVKSDPTVFGKEVEFVWLPTRLLIPPLEEQAIQELVASEVWSEQDAEDARDQRIWELQQGMFAGDSPRPRLLPSRELPARIPKE